MLGMRTLHEYVNERMPKAALFVSGSRGVKSMSSMTLQYPRTSRSAAAAAAAASLDVAIVLDLPPVQLLIVIFSLTLHTNG